MALEIKVTPTLKGKSAERFLTLVDKNEGKRISIAKRKKLTTLANAVLRKAKI